MKIQNLKIEVVKPSPQNPRKTFEADAMKELAESIESQGLLQAITVRPIADGNADTMYEVVCGERRYRAFKMLSEKDSERFSEIPCIIREMTDAEAFEAMITENLQRKDVDPIEEAVAFAQLYENGYTTCDIAAKLGKSHRYVLDRIKLNGLIPELRRSVRLEAIPISGAIMLSKLDKNHQLDFFNSYKGYVDALTIKNYISNLFMSLENSLWCNDDNWDDGTFKSCNECSMNTANHGCLFYEMKTESGRCTNRECYNNKIVASIMRNLERRKHELVKDKEAIEYNKAVVIMDGVNAYWADEKKELYHRILKSIRGAGYMVVNAREMFDRRCYYSNDDERITEMLNDNLIYKCYNFFNYSGPEFTECYYYVRKDLSTEGKAIADPIEVERGKLKSKIESAENKLKEHVYNALSAMLSRSDYNRKDNDLSEFEQIAFDVYILKSLNYLYQDSIGLHENRIVDYIQFVKDHQADRNKWYREFILEHITGSYNPGSASSIEIQKNIANEHYSDDAYFATSSIIDKYNEKIEKLKEKLNELNEEA